MKREGWLCTVSVTYLTLSSSKQCIFILIIIWESILSFLLSTEFAAINLSFSVTFFFASYFILNLLSCIFDWMFLDSFYWIFFIVNYTWSLFPIALLAASVFYFLRSSVVILKWSLIFYFKSCIVPSCFLLVFWSFTISSISSITCSVLSSKKYSK